MQAALRSSSTGFFKNLASNYRSATLSSKTVSHAANFSTATQQAKGQSLKNRPLSPFLSQKRPEKSSIISIGERMLLIGIGFAILPAPEIAKMAQFMY